MFETRLKELSELKAGWYAGTCSGAAQGQPITPAAVETAGELLALGIHPNPHIYPMLDGGIRIEGAVGRWKFSVEISAYGQVGDGDRYSGVVIEVA